jgi:hypothetical protein
LCREGGRINFNGESTQSLFKQVCQVAMTMGLIRLGEVAFHGTRVKASNSRYRTLNTLTLTER